MYYLNKVYVCNRGLKMGDSYSMKLPQELAGFFQKYIDEHKELGYKFISQYVLHVLQDHAKELLNLSGAPKERERVITLRTGTYTKEEIKKILENMRE